MSIFPKKPSDKMIFENSDGMFYMYCSSDNSWNRLPGVDQLGLATETNNGLMSKVDLEKLEGLLVPPPQTTIKGEQCDFTYKTGTMALYNSDEFLSIKGTLSSIENGETIENNFNLHQNTQGVNFGVNIDKLFEELEDRGNIRRRQIEGDIGDKGKTGANGIDELETGPVGDAGPDGVNSPFLGTVLPEAIQFERVDEVENRAIVDIRTEEVSENENYLVVKRANIGNVDASPVRVAPTDLESFWLMALDMQPSKAQRVIENANCTDKIICRSTTSSVYYINMLAILENYEDRYQFLLNKLKTDKEQLVTEYLKVMLSMFVAQKSAICCALENCRSRNRNSTDRRYIESQRVQAAQAGYNIEISNDPKQYIDMNQDKVCAVSTPGASLVEAGDADDCNDCVVRVTLDGSVNSGREENAVAFSLPEGEYIVSIEECCINESVVKGRYNGQVILKYQHEPINTGGGGAITEATATFPDCGTYDDAGAAENAYIGLTLQISHAGGTVKAWAPDPFPQDNSGTIEVCFRKLECFEQSFGTDDSETDETIFVYRNAVGDENFLGAILPFVGPDDATTNYGYGLGTDVNGPNIMFGCQPATTQTNLFFYDGSDGLSFFTTNGKLGIGRNIVQYDYDIINNTVPMDVIVSDDTGELVKTSDSSFKGTWTQDGDADGGVIGPFDRRDDAPWIMEFAPNNPGTLDIIKICSRDSNDLYIPAPPGTTLPQGVSVRGTVAFEDKILVAEFDANDGLKLVMNGAVSQGKPTRKGSSSTTALSNRLTRGPDCSYLNDGQNIARSTFEGIFNALLNRLDLRGGLFGLRYYVAYDDGTSEEFQPFSSVNVRGGWSFFSQINFKTGYETPVSVISQGDPILAQQHRATFATSPICDPAAYANASGAGGWATSNPSAFAGEPSIDRYCERFLVSYLRFKKPGKLYAFVNTGNRSFATLNVGQYDIMWSKCPSTKFDENLNPVPDFSINGTQQNFAPVTPFCEDTGVGSDLQKLVFTKIRDGCLMPWQKIEWYERGWRTGLCCGAHIELNGQRWLIVKRSIGIDMTCGGGENENEECVRTFINRLGHPAIAWPTVDGDEFFGRPTSGSTTFVYDQNLSNQVTSKLAAGDVLDTKGDTAQIPIILFPRLD